MRGRRCARALTGVRVERVATAVGARPPGASPRARTAGSAWTGPVERVAVRSPPFHVHTGLRDLEHTTQHERQRLEHQRVARRPQLDLLSALPHVPGHDREAVDPRPQVSLQRFPLQLPPEPKVPDTRVVPVVLPPLTHPRVRLVQDHIRGELLHEPVRVEVLSWAVCLGCLWHGLLPVSAILAKRCLRSSEGSPTPAPGSSFEPGG